MKYCLRIITVVFVIISSVNISPINAQTRPDLGNTEIAQYGPKSREELETFLDSKAKELMKRYHVPGLMISYVRGDKILLNKGYGVKDLTRNKKINPETDFMLVGSVAKVFVTTAVMQQVDRGKINLDEDVNTYLDFKIKNAFKEKITTKMLMQHTAGFEEYYTGQVTRDKDKVLTLGESVRNYQPKVVYRPGDIYTYSNYGYNLLGYLVERVTGQDFARYVKENIFLPLEMSRSSFRNRLSSAMFEDDEFVKGYHYDSKKDSFSEDRETAYWIQYPAGGMITNTHDLGNFMIMYLNQGKFRGRVILKPESVKAVQEEVFTPHKDLLGQAVGFTINEINGHRTVEKSGDAMGWTGHVVLFPEYRQGFSYSYNTIVSGFNLDLQNAIADKFFPDISKKQDRYNMPKDELKKFEGYYRLTRYNQSGVAKLMVLLSPQHNILVKANDDGTISIGAMLLDDTMKYEPISKDSFQRVGEDILEGPGIKEDLGDRIAFRLDDKSGRPEYLFFTFEKLAMERMPWWQYGIYSIFAVLFYAVIAILVVLYWPIGKLIKFLRKGGDKTKISKEQETASWLGGIAAALITGFMVIMYTKFNEELLFGIPLILKIGLVVPVLSIPFLLALAFFTVRGWQEKYWRLPSRLLYSLFTFSVFVFVLLSWFYNLIGWKYWTLP